MATQQPGAWQTASRSRQSHSASRTPQNRSGTASPSQQTPTPPTQPPRQETARPQQLQQQQQPNSNIWTQRSGSVAGGSNGQLRPGPAAAVASQEGDDHMPVNGFNGVEVSAFLGREATPAAYKPAMEAGSAAGRGASGAWGSKLNYTANNQPFVVQLAKQIATLEGGG